MCIASQRAPMCIFTMPTLLPARSVNHLQSSPFSSYTFHTSSTLHSWLAPTSLHLICLPVFPPHFRPPTPLQHTPTAVPSCPFANPAPTRSTSYHYPHHSSFSDPSALHPMCIASSKYALKRPKSTQIDHKRPHSPTPITLIPKPAPTQVSLSYITSHVTFSAL